jgi:glucose/arabinose dehydrogenase
VVSLTLRGGAGLAALALTLGAAAQIPGFTYVRQETREASRAATLAAYMPAMALGPWHVIGPFDNTGRNRHHVVYPPETEIDLGRGYAGKGGAAVSWQPIPDEEWMMIDLLRFGSDAANLDAIAYLTREVVVERAATVRFETGSDDGLKLWVNGRLLVDADVYRGMNIQDHTIDVPLRAGPNRILAKVTQGVGSWQFQMRPVVDPRIAALIEYHLNQDFPLSEEARHYRILTILEPEGVVLEVGGLDVMDDGRPILTTRRGDAWIVEGADQDPPFNCTFKKFAFGLHEPLGALWHEGALYVAQRGELTRLSDLDGDDRADVFRTVSDRWGVSGNYHEFAFGPKLDAQGRMWVTLNVGFCGGLGKSIVPWRGWAVVVNPDGSLTPVCGGLRSPNGIGRFSDGAMFYTDNQGDWVGTNKLSHMDEGDWHGHPSSFRWYQEAGFATPRGEEDFKPAAVWFPYDRMGRSASDIALDDSGGRFGPFTGQLFVGDQYSASVMRVFLEKVGGVYQGACFPFREGFDCGVNRLAFAPDGSLYVGMTNRGWWSFGNRPWGLQRLVYTGLEPFEVLEVRATSDGFELRFTRELDPERAADPASYGVASFTHHRWEKYGSPEIDRQEHAVRAVELAPDGRGVRLAVPGRRVRCVHELRLAGVRDRGGKPLLHAEAWYTLNVIPQQTVAAPGPAGD